MTRIKAQFERGCIQVYTGNGKGKTTAAAGLALRAVAAGRRVFFGQFLKSRPSGEIVALRQFGGHVEVGLFGSGRFIRGQPTARDRAAAEAGVRAARARLEDGRHDLVILDEANTAARLGVLTVASLLELIALKPARVELVLTGRDAAPEIVAAADLVTEMIEVKHYFHRGVAARKGIES